MKHKEKSSRKIGRKDQVEQPEKRKTNKQKRVKKVNTSNIVILKIT